MIMSTGHNVEAKIRDAKDTPWTKFFLRHPVTYKPGTHFMYNTPATYMQSAIVQKVTGKTVLEYLRPRLFEPLGITDPQWGTSPQGINFGGFGLFIRTEDIAKFGQLYLQGGQWDAGIRPRVLGRAGDCPPDIERQQSGQRLDQGYGFSSGGAAITHFAVTAPTANIDRHARTGRRHRHHRPAQQYATAPRPRLGQTPSRDETFPLGRKRRCTREAQEHATES